MGIKKIQKGKENITKVPLTYSAIVADNNNRSKEIQQERYKESKELKMKVLKEKWKGLKNGYDNKVWNINKVIEAFKTQEVLIEFVRYKLETKETRVDIPIAIGKKLKYQDRAFFRSFTNRHETRPAHQNEFMDLLEMATNKYKQAYGAYVINKKTRIRSTIN